MLKYLEKRIIEEKQSSTHIPISILDYIINKQRSSILLKEKITNPFNLIYLEYLEAKGPTIQKQLAEVFDKNQSTITRSLNTLEDLELIKRKNTKDNKKNKIIELTQKGQKLLDTIHKKDTELEEKIFEVLTPEEEENLKKTLKKVIINNMDLLGTIEEKN